MTALPTWQEQLRALDPVVDNLVASWRPDGATEAEIQDMTKLALSMLASGYLCHVYSDAERPTFMPLWNFALNQGGPNPDYIYLQAQVDDGGVYEITGFRGTTRFVEITQQQRQHMSAETLSRPRGDSSSAPRRPPSTHELDDLTIGDDGSFRVILSAERPEGHAGDWWEMDPGAQALLVRKCACDWINEIDARIAINRLDTQGQDMTADAFAQKFSNMPAWIEGTIGFDMGLVRHYLEHHGKNVLTRSQWIQGGGGLAAKQAYYDGIYDIGEDEALVVEFPVPDPCRYWQILVADDRFATVDWVNRLSSLNDVQAHVDDDGWFRAVVSERDPGVHNWLDKAGFPSGVLQARFLRAEEYPDVEVTKVPVADVLQHLPAGTRTVTPEQRAEQLHQRRIGAQLRRMW